MGEHNPIVIHSRVTGKLYCEDNVVHIFDVLKAYRYMCNGAELIDLFPSHGGDGSERLCFIFNKADDELLEPLWLARKLR